MPNRKKTTTPRSTPNRRLRALEQASLAISEDLSLSETLRRIVETAAELAGARYVALGVPDESGERLAQFVTTGMSPEDEARIPHRPRGTGILGVILREGRNLRLRNLKRHPQSVGFPPNHPPMTSFLGVPIMHKGKRMGNLYLTDKLDGATFTVADEKLIEMLAAHAGLAIENARLHERVQAMRVLEERQRIGMDLHDGVIQSIYAVGLTLEYVRAQLAEGDVAGAKERLPNALTGLNDTIRDIRSYILDLRPRRFDGEDLVAALHRLLIEFKSNTLLPVEFCADPSANAALTPDGRMALFHIAQEALSNVARHSRASHVDISLADLPGSITLSIRDNGRGFEPENVKQALGHGLQNMRERAAAIGGDLHFHSLHPGGTEVRITVPRHNYANGA
jgi:signal transduction histidine kinase